MNFIESRLEQIVSNENIRCNEPMYKHTTFKTGGNADYFIKADSIEKIVKIIEFAKKEKLPIHIIGNGSNLIVRDEGIRGIVLKVDIKNLEFEEVDNDIIVTSGAGVKMMGLAQILKEKEITGFEELSGIPRDYRWGK